MAQKVTAPKRQARTGGIKAVAGEFVREDRLGINDTFVWEDSECGFPAPTRAGCIDDAFPHVYDEVVIVDAGDTYTFNRVGNTVTVAVTFSGSAASEGFYAPWVPTALVDETVTGGTVSIATGSGIGSSAGSPTGSDSFTYTTSGTTGNENTPGVGDGYYAPFTGEGPEQHDLIGAPFGRYVAIGCFIGGDTDEAGTYQEQARRLLAAGEDREVEAVLWTWAEAAPSPATADDLVSAIAAAEEYADTAYLYRPVLVMSRGDAQIAFEKGALKRDGDVLVTGNGTPVLATGVVPDDEQGTVVIIGQPAVYASEYVVGTGVHRALNQEIAVAQRLYALGVDCDFRYAVSVSA